MTDEQKPVAWLSENQMKAMIDLEKQAWIKEGHGKLVETYTIPLYTHPQPKQEPVSWESVLGAVARGWCYEENANKTMDSELATAIAKEVHALYPKREWVGLDHDEVVERANQEQYAAAFARGVVWAEARLRKMNT